MVRDVVIGYIVIIPSNYEIQYTTKLQ